MTTRFKAIVSTAIAAALTVGIATTAIAAKSVEAKDSANPVEITDSNPEIAVKKYNSLAETLTPFELAAIMGEVPEDPNELAVRFGRILNTGNDTASVTSPTMRLEKINTTNAFNYWVGNFVLNDGQNITADFYEPNSFSCLVNIGKRSCSMTAENDFSGNYKNVKVSTTYLKYDSNGNPQYEYAVNSANGNNQTYSISDGYKGTGKMVEIMFFFTLKGGTGSGAPVAEYAVVHFVTESYSKSAAFAAEPYSGLVDTYTHIPEELSE